MSAADRCPTCGQQDVDALHPARCAYEASIVRQLEQHAEACGVPAVAARDLLAHLRSLGDDRANALKRAKTVMDLGWRPAVGAS